MSSDDPLTLMRTCGTLRSTARASALGFACLTSTVSTGSGGGEGDTIGAASRLVINALICVESSGLALSNTLFFDATVIEALGKSGATLWTSASGLMV